MNCFIRGIRPDDWSSIVRIQSESYPYEVLESLDALQSHWRVAGDTCLVAEVESQVIGYLLAHPWPKRAIPPLNKVYSVLPDNSDSLFIHDLALSPAARKSGIAKHLINSVLAVGSKQQLATASLIAVQGADRFWMRFGFAAINGMGENFIAAINRFYPFSDFSYMERSLRVQDE